MLTNRVCPSLLFKFRPVTSMDNLTQGWTMKTTVLVAIATLIPGMFLIQANGGSPVAVIDFERAVSEAPGGKDALDKLNNFANDQRTAIAKKQQEADDLANKLRTQDRALSEAARTQLNKDLQTAEVSLQTMADEAQKK